MFFSETAAGDVLSVHCPLGCPSVAIGNDVVFGHVYALSNNPDTKFAYWVAYEVNVLNFGPSLGRVWKADPLIEGDKTLEEDDYRGANASAHLVPSGYFKVVYDKDRLGAGFVMQQNVDRGKDYCETKDSLLDIEALSGVKLPVLTKIYIFIKGLDARFEGRGAV